MPEHLLVFLSRLPYGPAQAPGSLPQAACCHCLQTTLP